MFNILTPNKFQLNATEMINFGIYTPTKNEKLIIIQLEWVTYSWWRKRVSKFHVGFDWGAFVW